MSTSTPVSFAKGLSDPHQANRLRALKSLNTWMDKFGPSHEFTPVEIDQLWRALQYTLWMADKRPIQQQVAAESVLMGRKIDQQYIQEWNRGFWFNVDRIYETIDKYRVPKIHLLIRIYVAEMIHIMKKHEFDTAFISEMISNMTTNLTRASGAYIHVVSIFVDELKAVLSDDPSFSLTELIPNESTLLALLEGGIFAIKKSDQLPISLISKTCENFMANPAIVQYSSSVRNHVKNVLQTMSLKKSVPQEIRDILCNCMDEIDAIPEIKVKKVKRVSEETNVEKMKSLDSEIKKKKKKI